MPKPTLIYDGDCPFCRHAIAWFQARDRDNAIEYLARQSPERAARYPHLDDPRYQGAIQCVLPDGTIRSGADATATALAHLRSRHWRVLGRIMQWPGLRIGAHLVYQWIAKNRSRLHCPNNTCRRPN